MQRQEFEKLALEHLDAVFRMCFHLTRDEEKAEDLVQEVYVHALRPGTVEGFEEVGAGMRAWLFAIAHNLFFSGAKRKARQARPASEFSDHADTGPGPDEPLPAWDLATLNWEQVDGRLRAAIDGLKPEYREVLLLWGVEGLKYRQIAEIIGAPIGTVMSRLHRARRLVAEGLLDDPRAAADLGIRAAADDMIRSGRGGQS